MTTGNNAKLELTSPSEPSTTPPLYGTASGIPMNWSAGSVPTREPRMESVILKNNIPPRILATVRQRRRILTSESMLIVCRYFRQFFQNDDLLFDRRRIGSGSTTTDDSDGDDDEGCMKEDCWILWYTLSFMQTDNRNQLEIQIKRT